MGQKVNPHILRLGPVYDWSSRWFDNKNYKDIVMQDYRLRTALLAKLKFAGIARVDIERSINSVKITPHVSRPGMVIGRAGSGLEDLKKFVTAIVRETMPKNVTHMPKIEISVEAVREPNMDAFLVAKNVAEQLTRRLPFKRILNQNAERAMQAGARGVKIALSGRINGAEIGRREKIHIGKVPLSTIREKIQYSSVPSLTKKGYIGVKVWINAGDKKVAGEK